MATKNLGRFAWSASRDDEGHRNYAVKFKAEGEIDDGPLIISSTNGLPNIGDPWIFGNDNDPWAFCTPFLKITPMIDKEKGKFWILEYKFTTKPLTRCGTETIENPLNEPQKISGSFVSGTIEATKDKDGNAIQTSSFEPTKADFDQNNPTVRIGQNVLVLGLPVYSPMVNAVNNATLWGLSARKIKLANVTFERKLYGVCTFYYTRTLDFDIDFNTFDRSDIPNRGKKQIHGEWTDGVYAATNVGGGAPDINKATHYIKATDKNENYVETYIVAATGLPSDAETFLPTVQYYTEANFLTLGIPLSL